MKNFGHLDPKISSNHATAVAAIGPASGMHLRFIEAQVPTPPTMTLRRDALPDSASPSNARLSQALRLRIAFRNAFLVSSPEGHRKSKEFNCQLDGRPAFTPVTLFLTN